MCSRLRLHCLQPAWSRFLQIYADGACAARQVLLISIFFLRTFKMEMILFVQISFFWGGCCFIGCPHVENISPLFSLPQDFKSLGLFQNPDSLLKTFAPINSLSHGFDFLRLWTLRQPSASFCFPGACCLLFCLKKTFPQSPKEVLKNVLNFLTFIVAVNFKKEKC